MIDSIQRFRNIEGGEYQDFLKSGFLVIFEIIVLVEWGGGVLDYIDENWEGKGERGFVDIGVGKFEILFI